MNLNIPSPLSLEAQINLEHDVIYHDPDHRKNTEKAFGRPATEEDLVAYWYRGGGAGRFNQMLNAIVQQRRAA